MATKKYFVYYINGAFEMVDTFNLTFLHMVEMGVIRIIVDVINNTAWIRSEEGIAKEVKINEVKGL